MSIPLDRLYNFLHDHCDRDVLIYRFFPHGSKKPSDLGLLKSPDDVTHMSTFPTLIFHDQEPLQFDLWPAYSEHFLIPGVPHPRLKAYAFQMSLYDKVLLVHSEKNSIELQKFEDDGAIGVYYWSHALIAQDWFRYAQHDPLLNQTTQKTKSFLIYNRAWTGSREYRLKFFELLVKHDLQSSCLTSFNPIDSETHYTDHKFKNQSFKISNVAMENIFPPNTYPSHASADYEGNDYVATRVEVVLETLFDDSRLHLTEKTLRPIATGHPFILCATPGSLTYLKDYGFKTFDNFWDESYDSIIDPVQRLECIIELMKYLKNKDIDWNAVKTIANFNKSRFFSKDFSDQILNELKENLNAGIEEIEKFKSKKVFLRNYKLFISNPASPYFNFYKEMAKILNLD